MTGVFSDEDDPRLAALRQRSSELLEPISGVHNAADIVDALLHRVRYFFSTDAFVQAGKRGEFMALPVKPLLRPEDLGEGLILFPDLPRERKAAPENLATAHSTRQQDAQAKIIILPGGNFSGRTDAYELREQLTPLLPGEMASSDQVLLYHYGTRFEDMAADEGQALLHRRFADVERAWDPEAPVAKEVKYFIRKFITPRFLDASGQLRSDPVRDGGLDLSLLTYSYGGRFAAAIEHGLEEALTTSHYAEYGFPSRPDYDVSQMRAIFSRIRVVALGLLPEHESWMRPAYAFPHIGIRALNDVMPFNSEVVAGLLAENAGMPDAQSRHYAWKDGPEHSCLLLGSVPARTGKIPNFGGHSAAGYVAALQQQPAIFAALRRILAGERKHSFAEMADSPPALIDEEAAKHAASDPQKLFTLLARWVKHTAQEQQERVSANGTPAVHPLLAVLHPGRYKTTWVERRGSPGEIVR